MLIGFLSKSLWTLRAGRGALILLLFAASGCRPTRSQILEIEASPDDGFHFPYLLLLPREDPSQLAPHLLVEPNNTGSVSDDFELHRKAARRMVEGSCIGALVAKEIGLPFLVPVFPRPETGWKNYTHALDRDTMLLEEERMRRIDLQLAAMIRHARSKLAELGVDVGEKVLLNGFSASGTFVNRFTLLHPELVLATASGGLNGIPMVPVERVGETVLPYPLGLGDFERISGRPFARETWEAVPQLLYMGAEDDNDAVAFDDGYSEEERALVHAVLGATMMPDRWERCRTLYEASGCDCVLKTYDGIGHGTDGRINAEIVEFFRGAIGGGSPPRN